MIGRPQQTLVILATLLGFVCGAAGRAAAQSAPDPAFQKLDINEDGVLSGREATPVIDRDTDGDGRVTPAEFSRSSPSQPVVNSGADKFDAFKKRFAELDLSEDGVLSGREKSGYEKFDANGDGRISDVEFLAGAMQAYVSTGETSGAVLPPPDSPPANPTDSGSTSSGFDLKKLVNDAWAEQDAGAGRLTEELFRNLDENEDDRLSGTEIKPEYRRLDVNGDGRITKAEFLASAGASSLPNAPPSAPGGVVPPAPAPNAAPDDVADAAADLAPLLEALQSGNASALLALRNEKGRVSINDVVLKFAVDLLRTEYGDVVPPAAGDAGVTRAEVKGEKLRVTTVTLKFARGEVLASVGMADGRLEGLKLQAPLTDDLPKHLAAQLIKSGSTTTPRALGDAYAADGERMVRLMLEGKDAEAFACFHPLVQQQLGYDKAAGYFAANRDVLGGLKEITYDSLVMNYDEQGNPLHVFALAYDVACDKQACVAEVTFQVIGLRAHIVSFQVKDAEK